MPAHALGVDPFCLLLGAIASALGCRLGHRHNQLMPLVAEHGDVARIVSACDRAQKAVDPALVALAYKSIRRLSLICFTSPRCVTLHWLRPSSSSRGAAASPRQPGAPRWLRARSGVRREGASRSCGARDLRAERRGGRPLRSTRPAVARARPATSRRVRGCASMVRARPNASRARRPPVV